MDEKSISAHPTVGRGPWNKGKLIGPKPPLRLKHVWAIAPSDPAAQWTGAQKSKAIFAYANNKALCLPGSSFSSSPSLPITCR